MILKLIAIVIIVYLAYMLIKKIFDKAFINSVENIHNREISHVDLIEDLSELMDHWNIEYNIEKDDSNRRMMIIIRKDSDPFFHVTTKREIDKFTK